MNCQEILQTQLQSDFKNDIVVALTSNGGINPAISSELQKLTSKKNFLIKELRDLWLNRGTANYLPAATIYEINLSHATKLEDKNKFDISNIRFFSESFACFVETSNLFLSSNFVA